MQLHDRSCMHADQQDTQQPGEAQLLGIEAATGLLLSTSAAATGLEADKASQACQHLQRLLPFAGWLP